MSWNSSTKINLKCSWYFFNTFGLFLKSDNVFEIKSDANIEGFPNGSVGAFYDLLLSSDSKGIKNTDIDEKFGLKYELYKDQNNQNYI